MAKREDTAGPGRPVTFIDPVHKRRPVKVGSETLLVENGRITVTDEGQIAALSRDAYLAREDEQEDADAGT